MSTSRQQTQDGPDDDAQLVARCRAGDASAWTTLVQRYQRLVFAIVARTGLDSHAAADVFQTVFSKLFEHLARIDDPSRLQAWVVTSAKREALRQRQQARRTVSLSGDDEDAEADVWDFPDPAPLAEDALDQLQQIHRVRLALERLDDNCQQLLKLVFRDEDEALSYQEVAVRLGVPAGSLGPTRSRCLDKLRRLLPAEK